MFSSDLTVRQAAVPLVLLSLLVVWGCCREFDSLTKAEDEAARGWLTESGSGPEGWIVASSAKSVPQAKSAITATLLRDTAWLQITPAQARELAGFPFQGRVGNFNPYLFRAVGDGSDGSTFQLYFRLNGEVWTKGESYGVCPVPMRRRAMVAWLDKIPTNVYVTFQAHTY